MWDATNSTDFGIQGRDCCLTNLDFAADITLFVAKTETKQHMKDNLQDGGEKVGLRLSTQKTKLLKISEPDSVAILINNQILEDVYHFLYLGSMLLNDDGTERDLVSCIGNAGAVFCSLHLVWSVATLSRTTKLHLYMAIVLSMAIYANEMWKSTAGTALKQNIFHQRYLRKILTMNW